MPKNLKVDFSYYEPINRQQKEFHESKSRHKLLLGGYGSGKTYPAIHESLFTCFDNPGHEFLVARNTWDSLKENVERETLQVAEQANAIKQWDKTNHDLTLHNDTTIRFRPLSMTRAQFKGLNICGFFIDDPNVKKHKETISFLYTRLRNSPRAKAKYFETIITANYEGRNWLWQQWMRGRKEGGDEDMAYWICPTEDNPTLPPDFITDLERIHSKAWIERFVHCRMDSYSGLIYDEYNGEVHDQDLRWCTDPENDKAKGLVHIMTIDVGITDPTVVLHMATDMKNVYVYDEWYKPDIRSNVLGEYLSREKRQRHYRALIIDRSSTKREQTSGNSVEAELRREFGVHTRLSNSKIDYGIEIVKTMLSAKSGKAHLFIDPTRCPYLVREMEIYSWAEPEMSEFDELAYKEKPIDKDNHACDAMRYGCVFLRKFMRGIFNTDFNQRERAKRIWDERNTKLKSLRSRKHGDVRLDPETKHLVKTHYKGRKRGQIST